MSRTASQSSSEIGNCPFQDWAINFDLTEDRERWLSGEVLADSYNPLFDRQMAAIAYYPNGRVRPLDAPTAARLAEDGLSPIDIYNLFEVDPNLGLKYVEGLIKAGQGRTDDRHSTIRRMQKAGHSTNMIASRLGLSVQHVRKMVREAQNRTEK